MVKRLSWSFPDPSQLKGSHAEKLAQTKIIRDRIAQQIEDWLVEVNQIRASEQTADRHD